MTEKAFLVGVERSNAEVPAEESLEELARLCETAGAEVVGRTVQRRARFAPATLIGRGKVAEVSAAVRRTGAATVVFDEPLSPAQQRNLEKEISAKVVDRTRLILDIFARRAHTREGLLQVELAQLSYLLPRLTHRGVALMQQTGGIGTRGPGERKLEYDRRRIRDRISRLKKEIVELGRQRGLRRARRQEVPLPVVALVGYTNAGKSTLLNRLSGGRDAYCDDRLFATLDPLTRRARLPDGRPVLLTDTVGFIRKLPTELVAAFRATLEEVREADALLHVIDSSDPRAALQEKTVEGILADLDCGGKPILRVYNKIDLSGRTPGRSGDRVNVSAQTGEGVDLLKEALAELLAPAYVEEEVLVPYDRMAALSEVLPVAAVIRRQEGPEGVLCRLRVDRKNLAWLKSRLNGMARR